MAPGALLALLALLAAYRQLRARRIPAYRPLGVLFSPKLKNVYASYLRRLRPEGLKA